MLFLLLLAATPAPNHRLQCDDARRLIEALKAAGVAVVRAGAEERLELAKLECTIHGGPPSKWVYACGALARGKKAEAIWDAVASSGLPIEGGAMTAFLSFSGVRCSGPPNFPECVLRNESRKLEVDLRRGRDDDFVYTPRSSCEPPTKAKSSP